MPETRQQRTQNALGHVDDEQNQQCAVDQLINTLRLAPQNDSQRLGQDQQQQSTHGWPKHHEHAARNRTKDDLQGNRETGHGLRIHIQLVLRIQDAADARHERRQQRDAHLGTRNVDADG